MQYSEEFKNLVLSGYHGVMIGRTMDFSPLENIQQLLETGANNEELGRLLKEGAALNNYFTAEQVLEYLKNLNLDELQKYAEMSIRRRQAYAEWLQKYNVQTQSQSL